jgi:hypothetical protein
MPSAARLTVLGGSHAGRADHLDVRGVDAPVDQLGPGRGEVTDHQLQSLERARLHVRDHAFADDDRAPRSRRGQLDDPVVVIDHDVVVDVEAQPAGVEVLGPVDLGDRHHHDFERPVLGIPPSLLPELNDKVCRNSSARSWMSADVECTSGISRWLI